MTGKLDGTDLGRMARGGVAALSTDEGLALLDIAVTDRTLTAPEAPATLVPLRLDTASLRAAAGPDGVQPVFSELVRTPARRVDRAQARSGNAAAANGADPGTPALVKELAGLSGADRERALLDAVRGNVATVLGHPGRRRSAPPGASWNWASTRSPRWNCATGSTPFPGCGFPLP